MYAKRQTRAMGVGGNVVDAMNCIYVYLIIRRFREIVQCLTLRGGGGGGSENNVTLTFSVHFSNFDSPLTLFILFTLINE